MSNGIKAVFCVFAAIILILLGALAFYILFSVIRIQYRADLYPLTMIVVVLYLIMYLLVIMQYFIKQWIEKISLGIAASCTTVLFISTLVLAVLFTFYGIIGVGLYIILVSLNFLICISIIFSLIGFKLSRSNTNKK